MAPFFMKAQGSNKSPGRAVHQLVGGLGSEITSTVSDAAEEIQEIAAEASKAQRLELAVSSKFESSGTVA
jgi:hypothetical protein